MIRNTKIDLSKKSQVRIDAVNSIKYTLLLDYQVPNIAKDTNDVEWVQKVVQKCRECCSGLFGNYGQEAYKKNFFGNLGREVVGKSKGEFNSPLNYMDRDKTEEKNLYDLILHQCVMSAYHAIVTALINDETVNNYEIVEKIKPHKAAGDKKDSRGIHYLYKKSKYCLKTSSFNKKVKSLTVKEERWSNSAVFAKKTESHLRNLQAYENLFKRSEGISLQFSDLWCHICEVDATHWYLEGQEIDWLKKIGEIDKKLLAKKGKNSPNLNLSKNMKDKADGLYLFYLAERLFNINLFYSVLEFIECINEKEDYNLCNKQWLDVLLECKKLPNALGRQSFLGYAIGKIIDEPNSESDYWFFRDISKMGVIGTTTRDIEDGFLISNWVKQFHLFVNYMAEFIIPVYEWCFVGMLLETIENACVNDNGDSNLTEEEIHRNHLIKAFELLASYIEEYAIEMIRPINIESNVLAFSTENLSVLIKRRYEKEYKISKDVISTIAKAFLIPNDNEDIELNLKVINPDFFKGSQSDLRSGDTNFSRVQKFYTDLIKITYLKK